jgi:WD40 repeat protein
VSTNRPGFPFQIWDARTGQLAFNLPVTNQYGQAADFSSDARRLLTVARDFDRNPRERLQLWNGTNGQLIATLAEARANQIKRCCFSRDGRRALGISTESGRAAVRLWDADDGTLLKAVEPSGLVLPEACAIGPDGQFFLVACQSNLSFQSASGQEIGSIPMNRCRFAALNPAGQYLLSVDHMTSDTSSPQRIELWRAPTGQRVSLLKENFSTSLKIPPAFSATGERLLLLDESRQRAWVFATRTGQELALVSERNGCRAALFHPDGQTLYTCSDGGVAKLWSVETGGLLTTLKEPRARVSDACFSPDGRWLITAAESELPFTFGKTVRLRPVGF